MPPDQNDTDTRLDTKSPVADRPTETTETVAPTPVDSINGSSESSRLFALEAEAQGDDLDDFVAAVTTIAQVWQQAKPFVTDAFALDRGPNWQIHETAFWEQHAYMQRPAS